MATANVGLQAVTNPCILGCLSPRPLPKISCAAWLSTDSLTAFVWIFSLDRCSHLNWLEYLQLRTYVVWDCFQSRKYMTKHPHHLEMTSLTSRTEPGLSEPALRPASSLGHDDTQLPSPSEAPPKSKTVFQIAHPPPLMRSKKRLKIRPRLLLQLQQITDGARAYPVLDVLPSSVFAPRIAHRFPKIFRGRESLGPDDLIIISSDSEASGARDGEDSSNSSEDEGLDYREVIGTVCQPRGPGNARSANVEICLGQGLAWEGRSLAAGGYEFNSTDVDGSELTARWIPRRQPDRRPKSLPHLTASLESQSSTRFTFSMINVTTRRHPVIASMTSSSIEVRDRYPASVTPSSLPDSSTSSPAITFTDNSYFNSAEHSTQPLISTDHHLRSLIVVTGVYVYFQEGWCEGFSQGSESRKDRENTSGHDSDPQAKGIKSPRSSSYCIQRPSKHNADVSERNGRGSSLARANSAGATYIARANQRNLSVAKRHNKRFSAKSSRNTGTDNLKMSTQGEAPISSSRVSPFSHKEQEMALVRHSSDLAIRDHGLKVPEADHTVQVVPMATEQSLTKLGKGLGRIRRFISLVKVFRGSRDS